MSLATKNAGLKEQMMSLGSLKGRPLKDITSLCGQPKESKSVRFSDIGPGTRKTWRDSRYSVTLNFDSRDICYGVAAEQSAAVQRTANLVAVAIAVLLVFLMVRCAFGGGSSSGGSSSSATCRSCGRTFTDSDNKMSIAKTHMCENCYENFQWGQEVTGRN